MSEMFRGFSLYTMSLKTPHKKKSIPDKSGERAGHSNGPRGPIHVSIPGQKLKITLTHT